MTQEGRDFAPMAEAVRQIGDGWTLMIIWAALQGVTRFDTFQRRLGVARNILSNRLARLIDEGILEKRPVHDGARRKEYRVTMRGETLRPILTRVADWGAEMGGANAMPPQMTEPCRRAHTAQR